MRVYDLLSLRKKVQEEQLEAGSRMQRERLTGHLERGSKENKFVRKIRNVRNRIGDFKKWYRESYDRFMMEIPDKARSTAELYKINVDGSSRPVVIDCIMVLAYRIERLLEDTPYKTLASCLEIPLSLYLNSPEYFQILAQKKAYRDHLSHVVFTWWIGHDILKDAEEKGVLNEFARKITSSEMTRRFAYKYPNHVLTTKDIYNIWDVTAFGHDIGHFYISDALMGLDEITADTTDAKFYQELLGIVANLKNYFTGFFGSELMEKFRTGGEDPGGYDHGVVGALYLWDIFQKDQEEWGASQALLKSVEAFFFHAFSAIFRHKKESQLRADDSLNDLWEKDPFKRFLQMIDELHTSARFFFGDRGWSKNFDPKVPVEKMEWREDSTGTIEITLSFKRSVDPKWEVKKFIEGACKAKKYLTSCPLFENNTFRILKMDLEANEKPDEIRCDFDINDTLGRSDET